MKLKGLILVLLLICAPLAAEFEEKNVSARVEALGGAFAALADDPSAIHYNPAGVCQNYRRELLSCYSRIFNLNELIHQYVAITTPFLPQAHLGMAVERFGSGKYQEDKVTVTASREIVKGHRIGFSINSLGSKIESTDDHWGKSVDFGVLSDLGEHAKIGFSAINVNHPFVNEQVRAYYRLGFMFLPNEKLKLLADIQKGQTVLKEDKFSVHIGQELEIAEGIYTRLGFRTRPERLSLGFGVMHREIKVDYSFMSHVDLHSSHRISLGVKF